MQDVRAVGFCAKGARTVLKSKGLNWQTFLDEGFTITVMREAGVDEYYLVRLEEHLGVN